MKTIADLNGRWWYRLVKVIYIFLLFSWSIGTAIGIYFILEPKFDNENSYITCENGENYKLEENGIYLYSPYIGIYDEMKIEELCSAPVKLTAEEYEQRYGEPPPSYYEKIKPVDFKPLNPPDYELVSIYTERNWFATIGYILLAILGWLLFFEIVRRVFYYVVLGSLVPKKNA